MMHNFLALAGLGGSGGGGSSDWSTCTMTIVSNESNCIVDIPSVDVENNCITLYEDEPSAGTTLVLPLYKGKLIVPEVVDFWTDTATFSGAAEVDDNNNLVITGDCSVTM